MTCFRRQRQDGTQSLPHRKEVPGQKLSTRQTSRVNSNIWGMCLSGVGEFQQRIIEEMLEGLITGARGLGNAIVKSILCYLLDMNCLLTCIFSLLIYVLLYTLLQEQSPYASDIILYAFSPSFNIFLPTAVGRLQEQGTSALTFVFSFFLL